MLFTPCFAQLFIFYILDNHAALFDEFSQNFELIQWFIAPLARVLFAKKNCN